MNTVKYYKYSNAVTAKYKDTRISIIALKTNNTFLEFKLRSDITTPRATHTVIRDKIVATSMILPDDTIIALHALFGEYIKLHIKY